MPSMPRLVFQSTPSSINDNPPALHASVTDSDNQQFVTLHSALESRMHALRLLPPLGHKDVDRRRGKLIEKVSAGLIAMESQKNMAWERHKLLAGLYGFPDEQVSKSPRVYHTGMSSHCSVDRRLNSM